MSTFAKRERALLRRSNSHNRLFYGDPRYPATKDHHSYAHLRRRGARLQHQLRSWFDDAERRDKRGNR